MPNWIALVLLLILLAVIGWRIGKALEVFSLDVHAGRIVLVKGRIPTGLLNEIADVLRGSNSTGRVTALSDGGRVNLQFRGTFMPAMEQRLRNVVGQFPAAKIRNAPRR